MKKGAGGFHFLVTIPELTVPKEPRRFSISPPWHSEGECGKIRTPYLLYAVK